MEFSNVISIDGIIQGFLVLALVGVTIWYAWQTHRQANASEAQITIMKEREKRATKEKRLDDIISWANNINRWDNTEHVHRINETIEEDNPLMKSFLSSMDCNADFIRFRNDGEKVILPIAETFNQQLLIDSITTLNNKLNEYLVSLGSEQMAMIRDSAAGNKLVTANIRSLEDITARYRREMIPSASQVVIIQATKLKLAI